MAWNRILAAGALYQRVAELDSPIAQTFSTGPDGRLDGPDLFCTEILMLFISSDIDIWTAPPEFDPVCMVCAGNGYLFHDRLICVDCGGLGEVAHEL